MKIIWINPKTTFNCVYVYVQHLLCRLMAVHPGPTGYSIGQKTISTCYSLLNRVSHPDKTRGACVKHPHQLQVANGYVRVVFQMKPLACSVFWAIPLLCVSFSFPAIYQFRYLYIYISIHFWKSSSVYLDCGIDIVATCIHCLLLILFVFIST